MRAAAAGGDHAARNASRSTFTDSTEEPRGAHVEHEREQVVVAVLADRACAPTDCCYNRALLPAGSTCVKGQWLSDRSTDAISFAKAFLLGYSQPPSAKAATDASGNAIGFSASGLEKIVEGPGSFGVPASDARVPDLVGIVQHGVVYTAKTKKIAEHGGSDPQDRHVPIVVFAPGAHPGAVSAAVTMAEIAPTILAALGLDPGLLQAVKAQHTTSLPPA